MDRPIETLVDELLAAWNSHDMERILAFYAPDYEGVDVGDPQPQCGQEGVRRMLLHYFGAFPDLRFRREDLLVADSRATLGWVARGTHLGQWMNIPPTKRVVQVRGVSLLTFRHGMIYRASYMWDAATLLREISMFGG